MLPANVRFRWYEKREDVKLENKFAAVPIKLPLISKMQDSYDPISKVTKKLKNIIGFVYTSYAVAYLSSMFSTRFLFTQVVFEATMKLTIAISNTPGPLKPFIYENKKGQ